MSNRALHESQKDSLRENLHDAQRVTSMRKQALLENHRRSSAGAIPSAPNCDLRFDEGRSHARVKGRHWRLLPGSYSSRPTAIHSPASVTLIGALVFNVAGSLTLAGAEISPIDAADDPRR
ncbi:MAG: hypothetical protein HQ465_26925 [Rhodospirillales bacterium]|nr:hypothetical protein [Rhodospirillales bacterium]